MHKDDPNHDHPGWIETKYEHDSKHDSENSRIYDMHEYCINAFRIGWNDL